MNPVLAFSEYPLAASLPDEQLATVLEKIGDREGAAQLRGDGALSFGLFDVKPWKHASHQIGFIPSGTEGAVVKLQAGGQAQPDLSLQNSRVDIRLDRLHIESYPGLGTHEVMISFNAANQISSGAETVTFNQTFSIPAGDSAAVSGYPVFWGINTGTRGLSFQITVVNVRSSGDESLLRAMDSDVAKQGMSLLNTAQPALKILTDLGTGLVKSFLSRNENLKVQEVFMGLDFDTAAFGVRLREGNYIVVQVPEDNTIDWKTCTFHRSQQTILGKDGKPLPYNYFVFRVSRSPETPDPAVPSSP